MGQNRNGKVITVMNMKGGVGKTTVTTHIAGYIARYKINNISHNVLAIDYDPQFNMSQSYIAPQVYFPLEKARKTSLSILLDDDTNIDPFKIQLPGTAKPPSVKSLIHNVYSYGDLTGLDIIPSTLDLMHVALGEPGDKITILEERFSKFVEECRIYYDLIFVDCHPAGSLLTKTAIRNSDHVLIPVIPERYAVRGIGLMLQFIKGKRAGKAAPASHILFNCTSRLGEVFQEEAEIRKMPEYQNMCMKHSLHRYKAFSDPINGTDFVWNFGRPWTGEAWRNLGQVVNEFLSRIESGEGNEIKST